MNHFAQQLEKLAQIEAAVMRPTRAQVFSARKSEKEYENFLKQDSPKAYATAIASGILSTMGIPAALSLGSLAATPGGLDTKIKKVHTQVYLKEALTGLYGFRPEEAGQIASALVSKNPLINEKTNRAIQGTRLSLAKSLAEGPMRGVSDATRQSIVNRAKKFVETEGEDFIVRPSVRRGADRASVARLRSAFGGFSLDQKLNALANTPGGLDELSRSGSFGLGVGFPGFHADEAEALIGMGHALYKDRTGKALSGTSTAIRMISKQVGNSLKAGIPIGLLGGAAAALAQRKKAKETKEEKERYEVLPLGVRL